jgi:hypothetical protein
VVTANSGEEVLQRFGVARRKKRKSSRRKGVRVGFYRRARPCRSEGKRERQSRAELRTAGGTGVPSGAWQPLGSGSPTWLRGERPAGAARAVRGVVGRRVGEGGAVQTCNGSGIGGGSRARGRGRGARGLEEDDGGLRCKKQKSQGAYCKA